MIIKILHKDGRLLNEADVYSTREYVEDMLEERLGFIPSLQENEEHDIETQGYRLSLHSDSYDDLEEEDLDTLYRLRITDNEEECTRSICEYLDIRFERE